MAIRFVQVDAFTDRPFAGNPAAVLVLDHERSEGWMRNVAREMNLSETAFLTPQDGGFKLRWFTPAVEVDLCGHATLAAAHVLWEDFWLAPDVQARFHTRSGVLLADRRGEWIELDFPATPAAPADPPAGLIPALGVPVRYAGRSRSDWLVELESEAAVRNLRPDITALLSVSMRGLIVTASATTPGFDFVSRFFAPAAGVNEDPVTGSAHCTLAPFWSKRLGKAALTACQVSERGGVVRTRLAGDRVILGGRAVTVLSGEITGSATGA